MEQPEDAIETTDFVVWIDDEIIRIRSRGTLATGEALNELVETTRGLVAGVPKPVLFDFREWAEGASVVWNKLITNAMELLTASAFVVGPALSS